MHTRVEEAPRVDPRRALGAEGERRAARHLARRGYRIVARNLRVGGVEVDLVARRGRRVVFVEVKTRRGDRFGAPEESLTARQRARLVRAAGAWLAAYRRDGGRVALEVRFDLIACRVDAAGNWQLEHWPAAFDAGD